MINQSTAALFVGWPESSRGAPLTSAPARAEDDTAVSMVGEIMSQGEEGEQNRMAGGGAG